MERDGHSDVAKRGNSLTMEKNRTFGDIENREEMELQALLTNNSPCTSF